MLGLVLLYVGIVLLNNGVSAIFKIDPKASAVMNIFVGFVSITCNVITIFYAAALPADVSLGMYYGAATGMLFGFTYLFSAINRIFGFEDLRPFGWYSLVVAIVAIPAGFLSLPDMRMAVIWWAWSWLWLTGFIETVLKKPLGHIVSATLVIEAVFTGLIPGFLMLIGKW